MAVYTTTSKSGPYIADGSQLVFPYNFEVRNASHIKVYVDSNLVTKGISVADNSITFDTPPKDGAKVVILREVPLTQETDIQNNTAFYPEVLEEGYDKLTMISQQLQEQIDRAIKSSVSGEGDSPEDLIIAIQQNSATASNAAATASNAAATASNAAATASKEADRVEELVESLSGLPIGAIYSFPASVPPEGAYLLNGQTIHDCNERYPKFWEWLTTANVRNVDNETYEAELTDTGGVCGAFVIDSTTGSVRLPKWKYQAPPCGTPAVYGNGLTLGLTENLGVAITATSNDIVASEATYGKPAGTEVRNFSATVTYQSLGVTTDPEKSGLVADLPETALDSFVWCIQVFNAATALSEQESAQLASQMQMKAQTDLANVTANLDFVVEAWTADDNSSWYRKYRSGWVEQGGIILNAKRGTGGNGQNALTFPVEFADTNYAFTGTPSLENTNAVNCNLIIFSKGVSSAVINCYDDNAGTVDVCWFACGQSAK